MCTISTNFCNIVSIYIRNIYNIYIQFICFQFNLTSRQNKQRKWTDEPKWRPDESFCDATRIRHVFKHENRIHFSERKEARRTKHKGYNNGKRNGKLIGIHIGQLSPNSN